MDAKSDLTSPEPLMACHADTDEASNRYDLRHAVSFPGARALGDRRVGTRPGLPRSSVTASPGARPVFRANSWTAVVVLGAVASSYTAHNPTPPR